MAFDWQKFSGKNIFYSTVWQKSTAEENKRYWQSCKKHETYVFFQKKKKGTVLHLF